MLVLLRKATDTFLQRLALAINIQQRRGDFAPNAREAAALTVDRPTSSCMLGTAYLAALQQVGIGIAASPCTLGSTYMCY